MRCWRWPIVASFLVVLAPGAAAESLPVPGQSRASLQDRGNAFLRFFRDGEWYFSWGYSKQYWAPSDIHVSQPSLGNDFTIHSARGHDEWEGLGGVFSGNLFGPQYNLRFGRFINDDRTIAVEISFDHSRYAVTVGQTAFVTGLISGVPTNANFFLSKPFFAEVLHNGANHLMINGVYRLPLIGQTNETFSVAGIGKAGVGIMVPHTSDTVLGNDNNVGTKSLNNLIGFRSGWWQINGWTTGVEAGLRFVLYKPVYLEVTDKVTYSHLVNLPAFQGTLQHSLVMNEIVVSLGITYDGASMYASR
jgi:hypothetical protein